MSTDLMAIEIISPEGLQIANAYLLSGSDTHKAAEELGISSELVHHWLQKAEVRSYIDRLYFETGFRNRERVGRVMDKLIEDKLEELDETGMTSTMDIADLLKLQHSMKMAEMKMAIALMEAEIKAKQSTITRQTNVQIVQGGDNYNALLDRILA